jgi:hypothetical protein
VRVDDLGLLTYGEAARVAEVAPVTVRAWASKYGLRRVVVDGRTYLLERELLDCEQRRRSSGRRRRTRNTPTVPPAADRHVDVEH